jgi:hypothetical protein
MRQFNERVVLQALRVHTSLPKADLARLTGLSAQTIGLITARLEEDGLVVKQSRVRGRIGQPSVPLALNPDGAFSIGIKVGRRGAEWLLIDFTAQVRERHAISYDFPDVDELLPAIAQHIHRLRDGLGALAVRNVGAGLAAPFQLGGWHRTLGLSKAQADLWNQMDLAAEVRARTDVPVSFARDTVAACVAELVSGRGHDLKSFLYIFVDTFVGGGLVINSHLHTGAHGNAGALASLPMQPARAGGALPSQVMAEASLWELEQRLQAEGLDPAAAYDDRALQPPVCRRDAGVAGLRVAGIGARHRQQHRGARPGRRGDGRLDVARLAAGLAGPDARGTRAVQLGGAVAAAAARGKGGGAGLRAGWGDAAAARELRAGA